MRAVAYAGIRAHLFDTRDDPPMLPAILALAAAQPAALAPTEPWNVRMDDNMCLLERAYLAPGGRARLTFQPLLDLPEMELYVRTPAGSGGRRQGAFRAEVAPAGRSFRGQYVSAVMPESKTRLTRLIGERALLDGLADGDALRVAAGPVEHAFTVRHPEKAREVLRECVDKLKRS